MELRFTKMQALGNDYIYVNCFEEKVEDPAALARRLSRRRFSVGADGVILILPSDRAHARMEVYNADGSRAQMCGNGIRCVGKFVYERQIACYNPLEIETDSGILRLELELEEGRVGRVRVEMGQPRLRPEEVPVLGESLEVEVEVGGEVWPLRCVGMGNPHAVAIVSDWEGVDVANVGGWIERHRLFPERVNVEFVEVCGRDRVRMRVWERGSGETLACGTGACAAVVACVLGGYTDRRVKVQLRGGELEVEWEESSNRVYMTGSADWVYEGVWRERW